VRTGYVLYGQVDDADGTTPWLCLFDGYNTIEQAVEAAAERRSMGYSRFKITKVVTVLEDAGVLLRLASDAVETTEMQWEEQGVGMSDKALRRLFEKTSWAEDGDYEWDGRSSYEDEPGSYYYPECSTLGSSGITLGHVYEGAHYDCRFLEELLKAFAQGRLTVISNGNEADDA